MCGDTQGRERGAELKLAVLRPFVLWLVRPRRAQEHADDKLTNDQRGSRRSQHESAARLGGVALPGSPPDFGKLIADDTEKWGKVVKLSGAKPE